MASDRPRAEEACGGLGFQRRLAAPHDQLFLRVGQRIGEETAVAKAAAPGDVMIASGENFKATALPDPFDARDLEYLPRLEPLPAVVNQRAAHHVVLHQNGSSCTGHAVAGLMDTVLARMPGAGGTPPRVSPYMLYRLGRRYDEFPGEADAGSSLRGVFRGWFHHGAALAEAWPTLRMNPEPDLSDEAFIRACRERPLGAYYRVNPFRLDDMQSAINELYAVAVSGAVHDGWRVPVMMKDPLSGKDLHVILRSEADESLGGHAFILVGYNQVGFLVQNSWGTEWGDNGFATLPYDDWLDSAYDAWVARPGVPQTPFARARTRTAIASGGDLATVPGTDLRTLQDHVVDLGNNGRLSQSGKFTSWPGQIEGAFRHMDEMHTRWAAAGDAERRVVLYAHGGVVSEADGLKIAQKQLGWWLNNHVYPLFFVWESGPLETVGDFLVDEIRKRLPLIGAGWDIWEGLDRLAEGFSRENLWWMWAEMKENAAASSEPISASKKAAIRWPPISSTAIETMTGLPGASLVVDRLRRYRDKHSGLEVNLVGHSAGSIFLTALLARLVAAKLTVRSMSFMGAALRADEFVSSVLPHVKAGTVGNFANFVLSDAKELDDSCNVGPLVFYHKSLPYLVARGFERPAEDGGREVGLVGMARFLAKPAGNTRSRATVRQRIEQAGGQVIVSPSSGQPGSNCTANGHGEFDEDKPTMGSVLHRILGQSGTEFEVNAPPAPFAAPVAAPPVQLTPPAAAAPLEAIPDIAAFSAPREKPSKKADLAPTGRSDVLEVLESAGFRTVEQDSMTS
jgi:hypothetical protein